MDADLEYFKLLNLVLEKGKTKQNRTGTPTRSIFGAQARFDLSEGFPLLTTKKVFFKGIVHELLWFLSGSTNIKYLVDNDVHIWDEWAYKKYEHAILIDETPNGGPLTQSEFIERMKSDEEFAQKWGELGYGTYGSVWRGFEVPIELVRPIDQISKVVESLKNDPDSRRHIVSAWHPYWVDHCALPPCHCLFQFHTEKLDYKERVDLLWKFYGDKAATKLIDCPVWLVQHQLEDHNIPKRRLSCQLYQRSCDLPLGGPFNIASYSLLTHMIAQVVNMIPGEFIWSIGDCHIYEDQIDGVKKQLTREPRQSPTIELNPKIKDIFLFKYEDIKLMNYNPHPTIKMPVAV